MSSLVIGEEKIFVKRTINQYLRLMVENSHSALRWIDSQEREMRELVKSWAEINSGSDNLEGLSQMCSVIKRAFAPLGAKTQEIPLPPFHTFDNRGKKETLTFGNALHFIKNPQAKLRLFLGGHMDTVFGKEHPFQNVEKRGQTHLKGPGVADMKGGLIVLLKTLEALERSPFADKIGWEVVINPDEEIGSPGSSFLFTECARRCQMAFLYEPALPDGSIVSRRKGSISFIIVVKGKAAHVGRDPEKGRSAIFALAKTITSLEHLHRPEKGNVLNVGTVGGGGRDNIIADSAFCRVNYRSYDEKSIGQSEQEIQKILKEIENHYEVQCLLHPLYRRPSKPFDRKTETLFKAIRECGQEIGISLEWKETGGVCDGNFFAACGVPTADTLGVIGENLHTDQETLILDSLVERTRLSALLLIKIAAGEIVL